MPVFDASYGSEFPLIPPGSSGSFSWGDLIFTQSYSYTDAAARTSGSGGGSGPNAFAGSTQWGDTGTGHYLGISPLPGIN